MARRGTPRRIKCAAVISDRAREDGQAHSSAEQRAKIELAIEQANNTRKPGDPVRRLFRPYNVTRADGENTLELATLNSLIQDMVAGSFDEVYLCGAIEFSELFETMGIGVTLIGL